MNNFFKIFSIAIFLQSNAMHFCDKQKKVIATHSRQEFIALPEHGRILVIETNVPVIDQQNLEISAWIYQHGVHMGWASGCWHPGINQLISRYKNGGSKQDIDVIELKIKQAISHPDAQVFKQVLMQRYPIVRKFDQEIHIHNTQTGSSISFSHGSETELNQTTSKDSCEKSNPNFITYLSALSLCRQEN